MKQNENRKSSRFVPTVSKENNYQNMKIENPGEESKKVKEKPLLERYSSVWKCGICQKIGSTKKITVAHLREVHNVTQRL